MRTISTSKGWRSIRSVEVGTRPSASEISLPAPAKLPLAEDHVSSLSALELTFFMPGILPGHERESTLPKERERGSPMQEGAVLVPGRLRSHRDFHFSP